MGRDADDPGDFTQEIIQSIKELIPYIIVTQASTINPVYFLLIPVLFKVVIKIAQKVYAWLWITTKEDRCIQYFSRAPSCRDNRIYNILSWFLSKHMKELKLNRLSCEDYSLFEWGECSALDRIEPLYELGHRNEGENRDQENLEIEYIFKGNTLTIVPGLDSKKVGKDTIERKVLSIYAEDLTVIQDFIEHCQKEYEDNARNKSKEFYHYHEWDDDDKTWESHPIHTNKTFDNVFLEDSLKNNLIKTIDTFIDRKDYYEEMGIPHKKGMIFYGKPGCGKTSTEYAIANYYKRNIYIIRLDELSTSEKLKKAMLQIEENAVVVFEDIDTHKVTHHRSKPKTKKKSRRKSCDEDSNRSEQDELPGDEEEDEESDSEEEEDNSHNMLKNMLKMQHRIMQTNHQLGAELGTTPVGDYTPLDFSSDWNTGLFQTLLEVLDGYNFLPGAIIIFTTNYVEKLDDALIRFGRIDHRYHFSYPSRENVSRIFKSFFKLNEDDERLQKVLTVTPPEEFSSSELINGLIMPNLETPDEAFRNYFDKCAD